jgi:hypothetical protein
MCETSFDIKGKTQIRAFIKWVLKRIMDISGKK